jgi:regulatory protein
MPPRARSRRAPKPQQPEDPLARAKAIALRQVAVRARTEAQLRARLARDELEAQADAVIAWLKGLGYLDDAAYARARARGLLAPGQLGPRKVELRLVQAGLPPAAARAAVREALSEDGADPRARERELCRLLAERRARGPLGDLDDPARARLARFLASRGFSGGVVSAVLGIHVDVEL